MVALLGKTWTCTTCNWQHAPELNILSRVLNGRRFAGECWIWRLSLFLQLHIQEHQVRDRHSSINMVSKKEPTNTTISQESPRKIKNTSTNRQKSLPKKWSSKFPLKWFVVKPSPLNARCFNDQHPLSKPAPHQRSAPRLGFQAPRWRAGQVLDGRWRCPRPVTRYAANGWPNGGSPHSWMV